MLLVCTCGEAVSCKEIAPGENVIQCQRSGCETKWVRLVYLCK
jgi:hypothetical protein